MVRHYKFYSFRHDCVDMIVFPLQSKQMVRYDN
jgi:hypothetical protein